MMHQIRVYLSIGLLLGLVISTMPVLATTTDSTNLVAPSFTPASTYIAESGYVDWPTAAGSDELHTFSTSSSCPIGFNPYVTITSTKVWNDRHNMITSFGACINQVQSSGSGYAVSYRSVQKSNKLIPAVGYVANQNGIFDAPTSFPAGIIPLGSQPNAPTYPLSAELSLSGGTGLGLLRTRYTTAPGGLEWVMYCVPSAATVKNSDGSPMFSGSNGSYTYNYCPANTNPYDPNALYE